MSDETDCRKSQQTTTTLLLRQTILHTTVATVIVYKIGLHNECNQNRVNHGVGLYRTIGLKRL